MMEGREVEGSPVAGAEGCVLAPPGREDAPPWGTGYGRRSCAAGLPLARRLAAAR